MAESRLPIEGAQKDAPSSPHDLADWLLSRGRHWITTTDAADLLGIPQAHVSPSLARWRRRGHLFSPTKGAYVPIPPEYRAWGAVPAVQFIDPLMRQLDHPYYVGLLSAAELLGVAHQRPQVFQVVTTARLRNRSFGRVEISFVTAAHMVSRPTTTRNTPTGAVRISTPEVTLFDLVSWPRHSGGISNVATVVVEMLEEDLLGAADLASVAEDYPAAVTRRTGWLLDQVSRTLDRDALPLDGLHRASTAGTSPTLILPGGPHEGVLDERWNVIVNADVEADL